MLNTYVRKIENKTTRVGCIIYTDDRTSQPHRQHSHMLTHPILMFFFFLLLFLTVSVYRTVEHYYVYDGRTLPVCYSFTSTLFSYLNPSKLNIRSILVLSCFEQIGRLLCYAWLVISVSYDNIQLFFYRNKL